MKILETFKSLCFPGGVARYVGLCILSFVVNFKGIEVITGITGGWAVVILLLSMFIFPPALTIWFFAGIYGFIF